MAVDLLSPYPSRSWRPRAIRLLPSYGARANAAEALAAVRRDRRDRAEAAAALERAAR